MAAAGVVPEWRPISTVRHLDVPLSTAASVLAQTDGWVPPAVGLDGVFAPINRKVTITLGPLSRAEGCIRRHLAWRAASQARLFPLMEGSITALRDGGGCCVLEIRAHYQPPFGAVGQLADRALMHLVASSSIERFADEVAERVAESAREANP